MGTGRKLVLSFGAIGLISAGRIQAQGVCSGVSTTGNTDIRAVPVATGIPGRPLYSTSAPGDVNRIFIVEQDGRVRIKKRGDPAAITSVFLDVVSKINSTGNEMGLLGLAFPPDYASTGFFYVNYTEQVLGQIATVVARYSVSAGNADLADPLSELRILRLSQPESNHNGGLLLFGPDGYLYVFTGDGGGGGDNHGTCGNGQSRTTLLGKILRIDVRDIAPSSRPPDCGGVTGNYTIPTANPFDDGAGGNCDEIWAYGLRNPWRASFDRGIGDLYVADVGQNCWEEIDYVASPGDGGQNYGWRQMEGNHCFNTLQQSNCSAPAQTCAGSPPCNDVSFTDPVEEYGHGAGCAVTGGYVYRGCRMANFQGTYFYGDYCDGFVHSFAISGGAATSPQDWTPSLDPGGSLVLGLTSFGEDAQGELYITDRSGVILKIVPPTGDLEVSAGGAGSPLLLSKTGDWTWEDLFFSTDIPVSFYRVYRGVPNGAFSCILRTTQPRWTSGGDPANPAVGQLFAYVVTAVDTNGQETKTGHPGTFNPATCP